MAVARPIYSEHAEGAEIAGGFNAGIAEHAEDQTSFKIISAFPAISAFNLLCVLSDL
jgi:hypothetical protein